MIRAADVVVGASFSLVLVSTPCYSQSNGANPIQTWLDRGRETYQAYLQCITIEAARFASQSCATPDDIFEASQPACRDLEGPFIVAAKGLADAGYPAKTMGLDGLLNLARPDVKATILENQIKHGCK